LHITIVKYDRKTFIAQATSFFCHVTQHLSRPKNVIAAGRNALPVDARVEGVWAAGGAVSHGGPQQVVGRRLLDPAKEFALVRSANWLRWRKEIIDMTQRNTVVEFAKF
jgi:hypothetical protein